MPKKINQQTANRSFRLEVDVMDRLEQYYPDHGSLADLVRRLLRGHLAKLEERAKQQAGPEIANLLED